MLPETLKPLLRLLALVGLVASGVVAWRLGLPGVFSGDIAPDAGIRREGILVPGLTSVAILPSGSIIPYAEPENERERVPRGALGRDAAGRPSAFSLSPPYTVESSTVFAGVEAKVRLTGIEGPMRDAVCLDAQREAWACGLRARAALHNLIRTARIECSGDLGLQEPVPARCSIAGRDLAASLVAAGFARPTDDDAHQPELREARRAGLGLWEGGWTIRPQAERPGDRASSN
jgi:endonuclease YncB( thermonuclease family)